MSKQFSTILVAGALLLTGCAGRSAAAPANLPQQSQRTTLVVAQPHQQAGRDLPQLPNRTSGHNA